MRLSQLLSLIFLFIAIGFLSSCQEEEAASPTFGSPISGGPVIKPPVSPPQGESLVLDLTWIRLPMPCPRPRRMTSAYLGGRQCDPGILEIRIQKGYEIFGVKVDIYNKSKAIYASSDEKYGGGFEAKGNLAEVYVPVVNGELANETLVQIIQISYVDGFGNQRTESFKENFTLDQ